MDENEIYEALGVTPSAGEAGTGQAPETKQENIPASEPDGKTAEAADQSSGGKAGPIPDSPPDDTQEPEGQEPEGGSKQEPSREQDQGEAERARQAAIQQAVAEAVTRERERTQAEWKEFFSRAGLRNSVSGAAITSREEFEEWYRTYEAERLSRELKEGKLTPEALDAAVRNSIRRNETAQTPPDRGAAQVTRADIDRELAAIHQMDESVNGLEDILKLETGPAFRDAVGRGHSFLDAFKLANFDRLQRMRQEESARRAAQAARNNAASKEHLKASNPKGSGSTPVPGDVMELYRQLMPGASEAEIQAHYNKALKDMKS